MDTKTFFKFEPTKETLIALTSAIIMIGIYYGTTVMIHHQFNNFLIYFVFGLFGNLILNVCFPVYYTLFVTREPLSSLGITKKKLVLSLQLSVFLCVLQYQTSFRFVFNDLPANLLIPHVLFNAIILWETFFVYGWLQTRYEKAFGKIPAIILAGLSFGAYHIGTYPVEMIYVLMIIGIFYAIFFSITKNLAVLFPLTWAFASSVGTYQGNMLFSWNEVSIYSIILLLQISFIVWSVRATKL